MAPGVSAMVVACLYNGGGSLYISKDHPTQWLLSGLRKKT